MSNSATLTQELVAAKKTYIASIHEVASTEELGSIKQALFGKTGRITQALKALKDIPETERKDFGKLVNEVRVELESVLERRLKEISEAEVRSKLSSEYLDVTLPLNQALPISQIGSLHPLTRVQRDLERIFTGLGFTVVDGPEVESEFYNFEALNVPETHPARDMQDTFWTTTRHLLRTHTSPMQVRSMLEMGAPLRIVAPGRVFRYERIDSSHEHTFYQMEGMLIDRHVTVGNLIYFMKTLLREIFGSEQKIRLRPGYFPFVEPGFELDIWFKDRWLELLPCGLIHPRVLEYGKIDPREWSGFAFGLGLSRLVMSKYKIDDIRYLQGADLRFLKQFSSIV
ncbi:phenylalanine--tRNA ligase subunit alpha [bacterium]|nr:phenylalanine--tRNA ligase subunit alpha [bacterium]